MAIRQIIPVDDVVKCHANSLDGSPSYESGVAYAAGTLVTYEGEAYTSIVDIEDTDSDTPDAAPDRWALTPNAFRSSGGEGGLSGRVAALEEFDENMPDGYAYMGRDVLSDTVENGTIGSCLDTIAAHLATYVGTLEDDEIVQCITVTITGVVTLLSRADHFDNTAANTNLQLFRINGNSSSFFIWTGQALSGLGSSDLQQMQYASSAWTFTDMTSTSTGESKSVTLTFDKYKKIKAS